MCYRRTSRRTILLYLIAIRLLSFFTKSLIQYSSRP
nr:MAG TPA: hypothetical protein [Crassvirales sp.]